MISVDGDKLNTQIRETKPDKACSQRQRNNGHLDTRFTPHRPDANADVSAPLGNLTFRVELSIFQVGQDAHSTPAAKSGIHILARV
jgi:hypothetical protein